MEDACPRELICRRFLPDAYRQYVSGIPSVSVAWSGMLFASRNLTSSVLSSDTEEVKYKAPRL